MPEIQVFKGTPEGKVIEATHTIRDIKADEVFIKVTHCGFCYTDIHYLKAGSVLGHEPVGIVEEVGSECKRLKKGDVVGWGYLHDSCMECEMCMTGREILCAERKMYAYADLDMGGMGSGYIGKEKYVFKIPKGLAPADAAPLMCAGATVFAAIYNNNIKPTDRVGVVGIGGLGHLALQFLKAWGCHVAAFSGSDSKKAEAEHFGAREFVVTRVAEDQEFQIEEKFDFILSTVAGQIPWAKYMRCLKPTGTMIPLGLSSDPDMITPYSDIIVHELKVSGSLVASRHVQNLMLEFAARHGIKPQNEILEMTADNINDAADRLHKGDVRYRFVLERK
ncbi:hypothetical protein YB2330_004525 [Saitoella coloradoensis]